MCGLNSIRYALELAIKCANRCGANASSGRWRGKTNNGMHLNAPIPAWYCRICDWITYFREIGFSFLAKRHTKMLPTYAKAEVVLLFSVRHFSVRISRKKRCPDNCLDFFHFYRKLFDSKPCEPNSTHSKLFTWAIESRFNLQVCRAWSANSKRQER